MLRATYHKETTVIPGNFSDQRIAVHFNLSNTSANQKFNLQFSSNYMADNNQLPVKDVTFMALGLAPNAPSVYDTEGNINWMLNTRNRSTWINPIAELLKTYQNRTISLVSNAILNYRLSRSIQFRTSFGYNAIFSKENQLTPLSAIRPDRRAITQRSAMYGDKELNSWIIEPQISFERKTWIGEC